eukprot:5220055-Lingulodinium_polyedra.AAC.1
MQRAFVHPSFREPPGAQQFRCFGVGYSLCHEGSFEVASDLEIASEGCSAFGGHAGATKQGPRKI